jgi:ribonucleoside-triphosphate reductase
MSKIDLPGKIIDVDTEQGLTEAASKGVFAAPTVIVYNNDGTEISRAHNVEELAIIFESVAVAQ